MNISNEVKEFLQNNLYTESYRSGVTYSGWDAKPEIDMGIQSERTIQKAERDLAIFRERSQKYLEREGFKVGERIKLPDGQEVVISNVWEDTVQTSHSGSMHLGSEGGVSFSGGLDSGLKKSDLVRIDEMSTTNVWIFHEGYSGGGRGVYHNMPVTMYKTKEGADLSGVPQVKELQKQKIRDKAETITRINGNGNPYTLPLPELMIVNRRGTYSSYDKVKEFPMEDCVISGLSFESNGYNTLRCQPMKLSQINRLLNDHDFEAVFYNNCSNENTLMLTPTNSQRDITRVFPKEKTVTQSF